MHISEYVCKICLKELGILLKCRETFEKFLAACNSSKNTGLPQFFSQVSDNCILKRLVSQQKQKGVYYADFYEFKSKMTGKDKQQIVRNIQDRCICIYIYW